MKVFGMGWIELVLILVVVLIIFGPKNLPKLGKAIGNGIKGLRKGVQSGKEKIDEKFDAVEDEKAQTAADADERDDAEVVVEEILAEDDPEAAEPAKKTVKVKRVVKTADSGDDKQ